MRICTVASFCLALAASVLLLIMPVYSGYSSADGGRSTSATLLQVNGFGAWISLAIPVLLALAPILFSRRGVCIGTAILLSAFAIVGGFSIGLFYVPSALTMIVAGALPALYPGKTAH